MIFTRNRFLIDIPVLIASVILFILPAVSYRYPLLFPDSGTYLTSGHTGYVPVDRPIIYGLFVKLTSFSWSVWPVIICQSLLCNYFLYLVIKLVIKVKKYRSIVHLLIAIVMAVFTGLSYYCSMILADIFSFMTVLSVFILLTINSTHKKHFVIVSILFVISIITHLSHIPLVFFVLLVSVAFLYFGDKSELQKRWKRLFAIFGLTLVSLVLISSVNHYYGVGFKISRTNNIILATRLIESGLVNKYLKKNCNTEGFDTEYKGLCNYIDQFEKWPAAGNYLYDRTSPIYDGDCIEIGWKQCWLRKNREYGLLIKDILSDGELLLDYTKMVIEGTAKQLITFTQGSLSAQDFGPTIKKYYSRDFNEFRVSLQNRTTLLFDQAIYLESRLVIFSLFILIFFIIKKWKIMSFEERILITLVIASLIGNALITSTLSNVIPRYQGRLIFLLPLTVLCILIKYFIDHYSIEKRDKMQ